MSIPPKYLIGVMLLLISTWTNSQSISNADIANIIEGDSGLAGRAALSVDEAVQRHGTTEVPDASPDIGSTASAELIVANTQLRAFFSNS